MPLSIGALNLFPNIIRANTGAPFATIISDNNRRDPITIATTNRSFYFIGFDSYCKNPQSLCPELH